MNLMEAKAGLKLSQKGHELLEIKYAAIFAEIRREEKSAYEMRKKLAALETAATRARIRAEIELGAETVAKIFSQENEAYSLHETCASFDEAFFARREFLMQSGILAEIENNLKRLKVLAERTKKRASALGNVVVPSYRMRVKFIAESLEENARDDAVRIRAAGGKCRGVD